MNSVSIWGLSVWNAGLLVDSKAWPVKGLPSTDEMMLDQLSLSLFKRVANGIIESRSNGPVELALDRLSARQLHSHETLRVLLNFANHPWDIDAATILRAMRDAYIQAAYIVRNRETAIDRASDYLDFEDYEKHLRSQKVIQQDNAWSNSLAQSSLRETGELRNKANFEKLKHRFMNKKGRPQKTWYRGTLADLAGEVSPRCLEEYVLFMAELNGAVHSASMTLRTGSVISTRYARFHASMLVARTLRLYSTWVSADLSRDDILGLDALCGDDLLDRGSKL